MDEKYFNLLINCLVLSEKASIDLKDVQFAFEDFKPFRCPVWLEKYPIWLRNGRFDLNSLQSHEKIIYIHPLRYHKNDAKKYSGDISTQGRFKLTYFQMNSVFQY